MIAGLKWGSAELLADDVDDVFGVAVVLGKDERLGHPGFVEAHGLGTSGTVGEDLGEEFFPEGPDDGADLIGDDDGAVELGLLIGFLGFLDLPALGAGEAVAFLIVMPRLDGDAFLGDLGFDPVDVIADVHAIGDGLHVGVFGDEVPVEESERGLAGRRGEADQEGVEVFDDLPPQVVDGAVAFVDDHEVEGLDRDLRVVAHFQRILARRGSRRFIARVLVGLVVEGGVSRELGVQALDGGDGDLADGIDAAGPEHLDVVEAGELAAVVGGGELLEFVDGLATKVAAIDEEEDAPGTGVLDEAIGLGDRREGLAGTGGHLDEGARAVGGKRFLKAADGVDLALAERGRVQRGQLPETGSEGVRLLDELQQVLRGVKAKDRARPGIGVTLVAEVGLDASALVREGQRIGPSLGHPVIRGRVAGGLLSNRRKGGAFPFSFNNSERLAIDEENVVGGTAVGLHLTHRHATGSVKVEVLLVLNEPPRRHELAVDVLTGGCFGAMHFL